MDCELQHLIRGGERPLFGLEDARLVDVTIGAGESGLKRVCRIVAEQCQFIGKYVLWETEDVRCRDCLFTPESRASLWYGKRLEIADCRILSAKSFREIEDLRVTDCRIADGQETFWRCRNGRIVHLVLEQAEYSFLHASGFFINGLHLIGKYAFQYARDMEIHDSRIDTKDAFWESDDCAIYDSDIKGEYLGWYSRNLRLVRCHISGTQPLCYCRNLILEDCTLDTSCDRCFEYSDVHGSLLSGVPDMTPPCDIKDLKM